MLIFLEISSIFMALIFMQMISVFTYTAQTCLLRYSPKFSNSGWGAVLFVLAHYLKWNIRQTRILYYFQIISSFTSLFHSRSQSFSQVSHPLQKSQLSLTSPSIINFPGPLIWPFQCFSRLFLVLISTATSIYSFI